MENLHIQNTDKFIEPYINFVNKNFSQDEHLFAVISLNEHDIFDSNYKNIHYIHRNIRGFLTITKYMYKSKKVFIHGLNKNKIVLLLFLQPWLLKKCYWIVWGDDLYRYRKEKNTVKLKVLEYLRKFVIKNMGGLVTHIKGDYELAKKWYGAKGKYYYSFMYPSNLYKEYDFSRIKKSDGKIYIQVGNSADPSNNHIEIFNKLLDMNNKDHF